MRFSRNTKIFRGGVDAAPFASLFFIVVLFTMLFYSHVFFPGVPIRLKDLEEPPEMTSRTVRVDPSGAIDFLGESYDLPGFKAALLDGGQKGTLPRRVLLQADPQANPQIASEVEDLLKGSGIGIKLPGTRLELPDDAGFPGARNPVVVVGINLNGQIFFQHQLVSESMLEKKLAGAIQPRGEAFTLLLQADKNVPAEKIVRLSEIASRAGFAEVRIATKPAGT